MIDELITLVDDAHGVDAPRRHPDLPPWKLLIVDDDEEVHDATQFVLRDLVIFERPLCLLHAYSAGEAREQLRRHRDIAVAILDVVMETERAGLDLVGYIRDELGLAECRIILRTGQPGYAPELTVIHQHDINDYRTKADLTHTRLITMVSTALRSYEQFCTIEQSRRGLGLIVHAAADLMEQHAISNLAEGVLTQLAVLLKLPLDGIVCTHRGSPFSEDNGGYCCYVIAAAGRHAPYIAQPLAALPDSRIAYAILSSMAQGQHVFGEDYTVLYLKAAPHQEAAIFLDTGHALSMLDRPLLEVFVSNIAACFRNVNLVERLNHVAYHDPLTHLSNRSRFIADLDGVTREQTDIVVALLDIEHFADLNDGLGQDIGNALLVAVAERLRSMLEPECRIARLGADVFGVIGPEPQVNPTTLFALFQQPFAVDEHQLPVTVTIGLCHDLEHASSGMALLKRANIALNRAKKNLRSHHEYYLVEMEDSTRWRLEIIHQLRRAFDAHQLQPWYQPQIALATGKVVGVEVLLRWPGEQGFIQPPDVFIPLAEYSGLIVQIGAWVLDQACAQHAQLTQWGFTRLKMAVNVSMPQFRKADFVENVAATLVHYRMPPQLLELEITESIAMDEPKVILQKLEALKRLGILIAIDDFGTGYSSLGQLRSLPIDCLKIDKCFVQEIHDGKGGMFAETIVGLSQKLGVGSVAEGVETLEQAGFLRALGCSVAQGYLYAKPMPADQLVEWLRQQATT
ncbi:EAL domain-containing protein [Candidatus Contendibacter odensensis]|uniref:Response regulator receiver modulated diguanylate cyclase/phosphodiesterase n=1 Tax=Candidatus Contendobacter odensis Run_B_J11 TaxID=1400861 RepID=A0A7U7J2T9_9GAMM|nr:EAL domain-containing protein [Candidatus Contendobacter odensis]CDH44517.1 putative response regulator receiver modulated diguanylate cyclase/phosphodiesterase [Candidatus Contendobacter odensis Run_B_J11]